MSKEYIVYFNTQVGYKIKAESKEKAHDKLVENDYAFDRVEEGELEFSHTEEV